MAKLMFGVLVAAFFMACVVASDPDPINDYCVADLTNTEAFPFNGVPCKPAAKVAVADFTFTGFRANSPTNNPLGIGLAPGFAGVNYPGLNTLGFALAKFNYAKGGLVPPHTHPRASEVITVVQGSVYVGFIDTNNKLFAVTLEVGDFFVFPLGLLHFQLNVHNGPSITLSALNAQNPGVQLTANALLGSTPPVSASLLARAFGVKEKEIAAVQKKFQP